VLGHPRHERRASDHRIDRALIAVFALATATGVVVVSPHALLTVLLDGLSAVFVLAPAVLGGLWLAPLMRLPAMPLRWHLLLGAALGIGAASLMVLLLGLAGFLNRHVWVVILSAFAIAGIVRLQMLLRRKGITDANVDKPTSHDRREPWQYLWLLSCPFLVLALLAASNAPGLIWQEEGFGYDVLEYHLQLPKEYFQAGRIGYAPHNVYANFPANVEMLYLLAMIVHGDVYDIGVIANMIHLALAVLTVFAAWVAGRQWSPRAGVVCGVMTASAGWLSYLCGLAYVENGMLFFGMASTAIILHQLHGSTDRHRGTTPSGPQRAEGNLQWMLLSGVLTGFACGCKYTALPLIAVPLGLATLLVPSKSLSRRLAHGAVFAAATLVTFGPWLAKNQTMTGDPVFPLLNGTFKASPPGWGEDETKQWDRGHAVHPEERLLPARLKALWVHVVGDKYQRFGPILCLLAMIGLFGRRRDRTDLVLLTILFAQLALWLFATHLFARFAVVLLIPLSLLCGRSAVVADGTGRRWAIVGAMAVGCLWNSAFAVVWHRQESLPGVPPSLIYEGRTPGDAYFAVVNKELAAEAKILLVGDARAFYFQREVDYCVAFNRNPFFEAIRAARTDQELMDWLRRKGYTHVLVSWSEVRRLDGSYGFSPPVHLKELEELFARLPRAGLKLTRQFPHPLGGRYVDLYEVPR
jgi:4-amino-4-deoxy-L-arabinose transferase-like glycosyltransferase